MSSVAKPKLSKPVFLVSVIGLVVFVLYLYYFVGISDFVSSMEKVNFGYYSLAFVLVVFSVLFYSLVPYLCSETNYFVRGRFIIT